MEGIARRKAKNLDAVDFAAWLSGNLANASRERTYDKLKASLEAYAGAAGCDADALFSRIFDTCCDEVRASVQHSRKLVPESTSVLMIERIENAGPNTG